MTKPKCGKWPYDFTTKVESLDDIDTEYNGVSIEEEVSIRMELDELEKELTPRQKEVYEGLKSGMDNSEIESAFGFNTNNAVRWQKHQVKNKYYAIKTGKVNEYICKDCAWIWKQDGAIRCPKCESHLILLTRKDIPTINEFD